jgi:hypothetical protein
MTVIVGRKIHKVERKARKKNGVKMKQTRNERRSEEMQRKNHVSERKSK